MKILLALLSLCASINSFALTPKDQSDTLRAVEPFVTIDLTLAPEQIATGCPINHLENRETDGTISYSLMLAAQESGIEVEFVEEEICIEK